MLKQRVITAGVMLAVFALLLVAASPTVFAFAIALIVAAAAWEWSRLCGVSSEFAQTAFSILVGVISLIAMHSPLVDSGIRWVIGWCARIAHRCSVNTVLTQSRVCRVELAIVVCAGSGLGDGHRRLLHWPEIW